MQAAEIQSLLSKLSELSPAVDDDVVHVFIPDIDDAVRWRVSDTRRAQSYFGPTGDLAVEFVIEVEGEEWPLIVTDFDAVFAPNHEAQIDSSIPVVIRDAPPIVGYTEMENLAADLVDAVGQDGALNYDAVSAQLILLRQFVLGATRVGMRPVRAVAGWLSSLNELGGEIPYGGFRRDPVWEGLAAAAADVAAPRRRENPAMVREPLREVGTADFDAVAPKLTAVMLDDEFLGLWRQHVPLSPKLFTDILTYRVPGASVDVALYEHGSGHITVTVANEGTAIGIMQLAFSKPDGVMNLDEVRILDGYRGSGLFQKFQLNAEQLARRLGLARMTLTATDIGAYAFAAVRTPHDAAMYRKVWRRP